MTFECCRAAVWYQNMKMENIRRRGCLFSGGSHISVYGQLTTRSRESAVVTAGCQCTKDNLFLIEPSTRGDTMFDRDLDLMIQEQDLAVSASAIETSWPRLISGAISCHCHATRKWCKFLLHAQAQTPSPVVGEGWQKVYKFIPPSNFFDLGPCVTRPINLSTTISFYPSSPDLATCMPNPSSPRPCWPPALQQRPNRS